MRRQILLASVGALALTGSAAFAADLPYRGPPPVYLPPPPIFTWSGLYVGVQIGYAFGNNHVTVTDFPFPQFDSVSGSPSGAIGGAHIGYNLQIAQWVVGLEGTVDGTGMNGTLVAPNNVLTTQTRSDVQGSIRVRAGIAFDRVLLYATGGAAFANIYSNYTDPTGFASGIVGNAEKITQTRSGWTVGGGIAYAVTNNWSIRAEYRYSDFGSFNNFPFTGTPFGPLQVKQHLAQNQVQAGLTYKFDSWAPAPVVAKY